MTIPLPAISPIAAPFWEACRRRVLQVQRCEACGHLTFPPDVACNRCLSPELRWLRCSGAGTVMSYSVVWRASQPAFRTPYVAAIVRSDEGWSLFTNVIDCDPEQMRIGMRVKVKFVEMSAQVALPYFTPSESERVES